MGGLTVIIPKHGRLGEGFSRREKAQALEHPGRRTTPHGYQSAVSWISDLLALRKLILLCSPCSVKFNFRKYHYRKMYRADPTARTSGYVTNGQCDACKQPTVNLGGGTAFVHEEIYRSICVDPSEARRKQRVAIGASSIWRFIQKTQRR